MKGDFSRSTFVKQKHYSSVRQQQGRVHVDADWNEEMEILAHRDRTTRRDLIGPCGGPAGTDADGNPLAGFRIDATDGALHISPGRYYVNGILAENEEAVSVLEQPELPPLAGNTLADVLAPPGAEPVEGTYLAFLDLWERHLTALEDPDIREVALGGPDTASRTKVVWQVRLMPFGEASSETLDCTSEPPQWQALTAAGSALLAARAEPEEDETPACIVPEQAGYRGLENQLYRVEVHQYLPGQDRAVIKWSRENGSVVSAWLSQDSTDADRLTVESMGRDQTLGFAADDWVELTDDKHELRGLPGLLVQVASIEGNVLIIDPDGATVDIDDFPVNPKIRRWDMPGEVGGIEVDLSVADHWIELEHGIQVSFQNGSLRSGDYWLIPARTAKRDIEWPRDGSLPRPQPPQGIRHHYCRLALLRFESGQWSRLADCRRLFPPLTEVLRFIPVGGDGQEAMPGRTLPRPLEVAVANGQWPVADALVRFRVAGGDGRLQESAGESCGNFAGGATELELETGPDGIAACCWRLDTGEQSQRVEATLLEIDGRPFADADGSNPRLTPLHFNANPSVARRVAYDAPADCAELSDAATVQDAVDTLCRRPQGGGGCAVTVGSGGSFEQLDQAIRTLLEQGRRELCICLLAGDHESADLSIPWPAEEGELHIAIHGCGPASRLLLRGPWGFRGAGSVTLRELSIELAFEVNNGEGAISFRHCAQVTITGCRIHGITPEEGPLLGITDADQVRLRDNILEASRSDSLELPGEVFARAEIELLLELFQLPEHSLFRRAALEAARKLTEADPEQRNIWQAAIAETVKNDDIRNALSNGEYLSILYLSASLGAEQADPAGLLDLLLDIRRAAVKARPGTALILGGPLPPQAPPPQETSLLDDDDLITLQSNEIAGIIGLYGPPAPPNLVREVLTAEFMKTLISWIQEEQIRLDGRLGSLHLHGNQLVRITVTPEVIRALQDALATGNRTRLFGLFGRCLLSDNLIEGGDNLIVDRHLTMTANDLRMTALPRKALSFIPGEVREIIVGGVIADTSIYTGNHGTVIDDAQLVLLNATRASTEAANLELNIR